MSTKKPAKPTPANIKAQADALIGRAKDRQTGGADLERLKVDFEAAVLTLREVGAKHGMSHAMVLKHAAANGWTRDIRKKIRAKADALVNEAEAKAGELVPPVPVTMVTADPSATVTSEEVVVTVNAMAQAQVRLRHRDAIKRFRILALRLLEEIEAQADALPMMRALYDRLGVALKQNPDDLTALLMQSDMATLLSTPHRVKPLKDLAFILQMLIDMERQAFGIAAIKSDEEPPAPPPDLSTDPRAAYQWLASQKANS